MKYLQNLELFIESIGGIGDSDKIFLKQCIGFLKTIPNPQDELFYLDPTNKNILSVYHTDSEKNQKSIGILESFMSSSEIESQDLTYIKPVIDFIYKLNLETRNAGGDKSINFKLIEFEKKYDDKSSSLITKFQKPLSLSGFLKRKLGLK